MIVGLDILILFITLIIGIPVPFCFASAIIFMVLTGNYDPGFLLPAGFSRMNSAILLAMPLFIMAGTLMSEAGVSTRLVRLANSFFGGIRGGLGMALVASTAVFGAVSGTASSAVAAIGTPMIPLMEKFGYDRGYSSSLVSASAVLALLIPPSASMIIFGWVTGQSVAGCFLATVGPGILIVIIYCIINQLVTMNNPRIQIANRFSPKERVKEIGLSFRHASFTLLMPVIILGGIYGGFFTPTEAAAVAVFYVIILGSIIYRSLSMKKMTSLIGQSAVTTAVIMLMLFFAMILSRIYIMENVPQKIASYLLAVSDNKIVILLLVNVFLVVVGMIMDDASGILLSAPLLLPIMTQIGVHPLQFAAIIGTNLGMGNVTPPVAPILYLGARIGNVGIEKMLQPSLRFIYGSVVVIAVTTYWPTLSLWLPRALGFAQ